MCMQGIDTMSNTLIPIHNIDYQNSEESCEELLAWVSILAS